MMSRFVILGCKLLQSRRHIGKGELSGLTSTLASLAIKFTVPPRVLGMLAQVDRRDSYSLVAPESLCGGFELVGTGEHRLIA